MTLAGGDVLRARLPVPQGLTVGILEFAGETSSHLGCRWWPCDWLDAYEFETSAGEPEVVGVWWEGRVLVVVLSEPQHADRLFLELAEEPDGPWIRWPDLPRFLGEQVRWDLSGDLPRGGYGRLLLTGTEGDRELFGFSLGAVPSATRIAAYAPFPNPSRAGVRWRLDVDEPISLTFQVLDAAGRSISGPLRRDLQPGIEEFWWNGSRFGRRAPAGIYFLKAEGSGHRLTRKVVLLAR
jgi:hypothetical protein